MTHSSSSLPQLNSKNFITDGGLETTLIFEHGIDLPEFAAFPLLFTSEGRETLRRYYFEYLDLAKKNNLGFILETPTWRASRAWGEKLGYDAEKLHRANSLSVELMSELKNYYADTPNPIVISGCIGPHGDGYHVDGKLSIQEAKRYHLEQIAAFCESGAALVSAFTLNYTEEAIGIVLAAQELDIPIVISFTVETDGRLPSGQPLGSAIEEVDRETNNGPAYYMINCAHPSHFEHILDKAAGWTTRIHAIRANASCKSHAELDEAEELDQGNPEKLGDECLRLRQHLVSLNIYGGCCGTGQNHVEAICNAIVKSETA